EAARVSRSIHESGDQGLQGTSARVFGDGFLSQVAARGVLTSQEHGALGLVGETARVSMPTPKQDYGDQGLKRTDPRVLHGAGSGSGYNQISSASLTSAAGPFKDGYTIVDSSLVGGNALRITVGGHDARRVPQQTRFSREALRSTDGGNDPQINASTAVGPSFAQVLSNPGTRAQAAHNVMNIAPESSRPSIKGNYVCVKVSENALQTRLELCKYSLIGRIFLSKGEIPWKLADHKFKLQSIWGLTSSWRLISLGRGFFHILLSSEVDKSKVWGMGSLNLKPGVLRLQPWQILSDLARGVGVPIRFDEMTLNGEFGHYARMLIDIDLSQPISDSLMVEVGSDCLFIPLEYERLPSFCSTCKFIGHEATNCRRVQKQAPLKEGVTKLERGRSRSRKAIYRPITKSPRADVPIAPKADVPIASKAYVPIDNSYSLLKKDAHGVLNLEDQGQIGSTSKGDKAGQRSSAKELENMENQNPKDKEELKVGTTNVSDNSAIIPDTLPLDKCNANISGEEQPKTQSQEKDSSSFQESTNDSLDTSDLSPTKVFASKDDGWQEVLSKKKKKASQA
ncbi:hypothetical protein TorRG33x02_355600, partial [Trema orientale]